MERRRRRGGRFGLFNYRSRMLTGGAGDDVRPPAPAATVMPAAAARWDEG